MREIVVLVWSLVAGLGLGLLYFGGLWLTVRAVPTTDRPSLLTVGSFFGRLSVTMLGFYLVTAGQWERLVAALVGFILMRTFLVRLWGAEQKPPPLMKIRKPEKEMLDHGNNA